MALFSSDRERRLWLWTLAVVMAIYSTLGLARTLAEALREHGLLGASFPVVSFDPQDILFNLLAGAMAVGASVALAWARRWTRDRRRDVACRDASSTSFRFRRW